MARGKKNEKELTIEERLEQALVPSEEQPYSLPENWCWVRFEAIAHGFQYGYTEKATYEKVGPHFIRITDIGNGIICDENAPYCKIDAAIYPTYKIHKDDIFIARMGSVGENGIASKEIDGVFASYLIRIIPKITPKLIIDYLQSPLYWEQITSKSQGTTRLNVNANVLRYLTFPLPPHAEQQRIVDRIESLFAKLDEAKEKAQSVVDSFEARRAAILHKAFTGELTELWRIKHSTGQGTWIETTIKKIADVKGGKRVPKGMNLSAENTGHPYIRAGNLKQGTVIDEGMMFVPDNVLGYIKNYTVSAGDVYITNVGACIGDCGVIPQKYDGANLTENAVKLTNLKCNNKFLALFLSSNTVQQQIKLLIASATLGKLSIANIKKIEIHLPTIAEQKEIVSMLDNFLSKEQQAKETAEAVLDQIEAMKKSILARAFRGELGTNDPAEESAVELLKQAL